MKLAAACISSARGGRGFDRSCPAKASISKWTSIGQDGSGFGAYGQHYDANGHKIGSEIHLGTSTTGDQLLTGAAATPDGGYIVVWMDGNGGQDDTYMQRYDASGATVMPQTLVNTTTAGDQWWGHVAYLADNDFVVTWQTNSGLVMQLFDDDGGKIGGEIAINQTPGYKAFGGVVALTNGGFVVTWESDNQDGSSAGVYMRQFDATGQAVTSDLQVNTYTDNGQSNPKIAVLADGSYVVTWDSYGENGYGMGIYAQHFSYSGKVGPEFEVSLGNPLDHTHPEIAALDDGGYVIVWAEGIGTQNIWAQRYDADDHAVGGEMLAGSNVESGSDQIAVSGLPDGGFVVSWTSENIPGNEEVYQKVFAPATTLNGTQYLYGTLDSDTLDGGAGGDWMYGGQGDDVYYVNSTSDHAGENVNEGTDEVRSTVTWTLDANVENLTLLGTSALGGSGNELGNILTGNAADNDLSGNAGNDTLYGGDGNDTIDTGTGVDSAFGGNGNDIIYGMTSSSGTFDGGAGDDTIFGTSGADTITGGDGNDTIHAGDGTTHIDGGAGSDTIFVSDGLSFISGGDGFDTLDASRLGATHLLVDLASGLMTADGTLGYIKGIEFVVGSGYGDTLIGDAFGNSLSGGTGDDIIDGGAGNIRDTLQGGGENDTVSYASSTTAVTVSLAMQDMDQDTVGAGRGLPQRFPQSDRIRLQRHPDRQQ
ncbi:MAG: calcium-binding protein [Asticcacaulis sp.]